MPTEFTTVRPRPSPHRTPTSLSPHGRLTRPLRVTARPLQASAASQRSTPTRPSTSPTTQRRCGPVSVPPSLAAAPPAEPRLARRPLAHAVPAPLRRQPCPLRQARCKAVRASLASLPSHARSPRPLTTSPRRKGTARRRWRRSKSASPSSARSSGSRSCVPRRTTRARCASWCVRPPLYLAPLGPRLNDELLCGSGRALTVRTGWRAQIHYSRCLGGVIMNPGASVPVLAHSRSCVPSSRRTPP